MGVTKCRDGDLGGCDWITAGRTIFGPRLIVSYIDRVGGGCGTSGGNDGANLKGDGGGSSSCC